MNAKFYIRALAFAASTLVTVALAACGGGGGGGNSPTDPGTPLAVSKLELADPGAALRQVCGGVQPGSFTFMADAVFSGPSARLVVQVEGPPQNTHGVQLAPGNNPGVPVTTDVTAARPAGDVLGVSVHLYADGTGQQASKNYNC